MLRNLMLRNLLSPHSADVHVMSFRISAYAQYQVTLNHQKKSANDSMAADRIKYHAMRRLANQLYDPPAETLPAPSPSRSEPFPLRTAPDHGLSNAGGNVDNKVFIPSSRPQVGAQGAEECLHLLAPHFAHVHEMSFRIKYLCAVAIKPSSNRQKKLANVRIAAYFLLGPAIAPDMWASRTLACPRPEVCRGDARLQVPDAATPRCQRRRAHSSSGTEYCPIRCPSFPMLFEVYPQSGW